MFQLYQDQINERVKRGEAVLDEVKHQVLIESYEQVLRRNGVDPVTDSVFYKLLMKIEMKRARG